MATDGAKENAVWTEVQTGLHDTAWIDVQKNTFTNWCNDRLKSTGLTVADLETDLRNGLTLVRLLEVLANARLRCNKKPRMKVQEMENLAIAFKFMLEVEEIPLVNIGPGDIHSGYLKLILGLIWHLILKYQFVLFSPEIIEEEVAKDPVSEQEVPSAVVETVDETKSETTEAKPQTPVKDLLSAGSRSNSPQLSPGTVRRGSAQLTSGTVKRGSSQLTSSKSAPKISVKKALLYYIQCCLPKMQIKNFTTDWCNGMALSGLVEHLKPNLIPGYETFSPSNALENTKAAMGTADNEFNIPQVIKPVHLVEQPDELSLMTYLSYFCNSGSIGETSLLEWINAKLHPHYVVTNFSLDWNNGKALGRLIDACSPGLFPDHASLDPENQVENVTRTLDTASDKLGINHPFRPQEMADCAVNKLYMMGYLTQYRFLETPTDSAQIPEPAATLAEETPVESAISLPPDATKVEMIAEPELELGAPMDMEFDTAGAGDGSLEASCVGDKAGEVDVAVRQKEDDKYSVMFTPPQPDIYTLTIKWGGEHVKGSPFKLNLHGPMADKVVLLEPPSGIIESGAPLNMVFGTKEAGRGVLSAACKGNNSGELPCSVTPKEDDKYDVSFVPPQLDVYHVDVKWSGEHVPGSPYKINLLPTNADKVEMVAEPEPVLESGAPMDMEFDTSNAGSGNLEASCVGDKAGEVDVMVTKKEEDKYSVSFTPPEPDIYNLTIKWGRKHVKGSPFKLNLQDPVADNVELVEAPSATIRSGTPLNMVFSTEEAGAGALTAACNGDVSGEVPCSVTSKGDNKYDVKFLPPQPDVYHVDVKWSGEHVPGSPFKLNLFPPVASNVKIVAEPEEELQAGVPSDILSFDTSAAGGGELDTVCVGNKVGKVPVEVTPIDNDKYNITFTPPEPDMYVVSVKWGGEHVKGSPFHINMLQPVAKRVRLISLPATSVKPGEALSVGLDTSKAGEGDMEANCKGAESGEVACSIEPNEDDSSKVKVSFTPPKPDIYHLEVMWSGEHVVGSPFKINLLPPVAEKVEMVAEETALEAGVPTDLLSFDTSAAGGGKLDAVCVGSKVGEVPVEVTPAGDDKFNVTFTPPEPDVYKINVKWGGEHVKGSPFTINMVQPVPSRVKLVSPPPDNIETGAPLSLGFDTAKAGEGTMAASCIGEESGHVQCSVEPDENNSNRKTISFVPPKPDVYNLSVTWSGEDIPGSTFKINLLPPVAENVEVVAEPETELQAGVPTDILSFDTSAAGGGKLDAVCTGSKVGDVPVEVTPAGDDKFRILFTPPELDMYEVSVKWAGEHVKGSPFKIDMLRPVANKVKLVSSPSTIIKSGATLNFGFDVSKAGQGTMEASCTGDESGPLDCSVQPEDQNTLDVSFVPPQPDVFQLNVKWSGEDVPGSPYKINLLPPVAENVELVTEPPVQQEPGDLVDLDFDTSGAGGGELQATCVGSKCGDVPVEVLPAGNDKYKIHFTPPEPDVYEVSVKWAGEHVKGSPFKISTRPPSPVSEQVEMVEADEVEAGLDLDDFYDEDEDRNFEEETESPLVYYIGQVFHLGVDHEEGEEADRQLNVDCKGKETGRTNFDVFRNINDTYTVQFEPTIPDRYTLSALMDGEHIPGSPFVIDFLTPIDPSKVKVSGLPTRQPQVNSTLRVIVDCSEAGSAELSVSADGPSEEVSEPKVNQKDEDHYSIAYTPTTVGVHKLNIEWDEVPLPCSPLVFDVSKEKAEPFPHGSPINLDIIVEGTKLKNISAYAIHEPTNEKLKVTVKKADKKEQVKLIFKPKLPGIYHVYVLAKEEEISDSPLKVKYSKPFNPNAVKVVALGSEPHFMWEPIELTVDCKDAGLGNLSVKSSEPDAFSPKACKTTDNEDDTYSVIYVPTTPGEHRIDITWSDKIVEGSPLRLQVFAGGADCVKLAQAPEHDLQLGTDISHVFDCSTAGKGVMEATCVGKTAGEQPCTVEQNKNNDKWMDVRFTPSQEDIYHVDVKWSGDEVPGSPFKVNLLPPVAENVEMVSHSDNLEAGAPVDLDFDTSEAGGGTLDTACLGEQAGDISVDVKPLGDDRYRISFTPPQPDTYEITIKWGGKHVKGSPFKIDVMQSVPKNVKLVSLPSTSVKPGEPLTMVFDTSKAGKGIMEATCSGKKAGEILCSVIPNNDDSSKVSISFTPPQPDIYQFKVTWSGDNVPGSPFKISLLPPVAENVKVVAEPETALEKGVDSDFLSFDTSDAGEGKLDAVCVGRKVGTVPVEVLPDGEDKFRIEFEPPEPDIFDVSVKWGREHVKGSPFTINMLKPVAHRVKLVTLPSTSVEADEPLSVTFDTNKAGEGTMEATCNGEKSGEVACSIDTNEDDRNKVKVSFIPPQPDVYNMNVTWSGDHVSGSPFKINLLPSVAENVEVVAEPEASLQAGVPTDLLSFDTSTAGAGKLDAVCVGSKVGEVPVEVTPTGDDKFNIQFIPPEPDMYEVSVLWGGEHVKGSPFKIDMLKPKAHKVLLISPPSEHIQVGSAVNLGYDTANAGKGVMEASCTGDATIADIPCTVQQDKNDSSKVTVSFVPLQPSVYHLSVKWSGEHVPSSPYKINLLPPIVDEVDTIEQAVVEAEVPVDILNIDAPGGELETTCIGNRVGEVPVEVTSAGDEKYTILFNPPEPDLYEVTVKFEGKHVKGSPFKINTLRPEASKVKLVSPPMTNIESGDPVTMAFDTTDAGSGRLEASCNGEASGTVKCTANKDKEKENHVNVSFVPPQHDIYHISVKWSGVHVPRSPFKINMLPPVAGRVRVITKPPLELENGSPVEMELDTSEAGGGHLSATCIGKSVDEMPVDVERQRPGIYKVSFTPVDPDSYDLNVKWGGKHIRGSPFNINMLPSNNEDSQPVVHKLEFEPSAVEDEPEQDVAAPIESSIRVLPANLSEAEDAPREFIYGHPVELYTDSIDVKHKNVKAHAINQETNEQIPVVVKKFDRDHNKLVFKPKVPGIYHVHVFVNQDEISTSPYKVKYREPFNATAVKMKLLDSEPYTVGERVKLMIDCTDAGKGNLSVKATGPAFGSKPKCEVTDNRDGTYLVTYLLNSAGKYKVEVSESGKPVAGSPVKVKVVQTVAERVTLSDRLPSTIKPAWTTSLNFTTSRAGDGKLSASCVGEQCGKVPCDVTDREDTAAVSFTPPRPDVYHIDVKWSGSHVPGSPFKLISSDDAEA